MAVAKHVSSRSLGQMAWTKQQVACDDHFPLNMLYPGRGFQHYEGGHPSYRHIAADIFMENPSPMSF